MTRRFFSAQMAWATERISRAFASESRDQEVTTNHRHLRVGLAPLFLYLLISCTCLQRSQNGSGLAAFDPCCVSALRPKPHSLDLSSVPGVRFTFVSCRLLRYRFQVSSNVIFGKPKHFVSMNNISRRVLWQRVATSGDTKLGHLLFVERCECQFPRHVSHGHEAGALWHRVGTTTVLYCFCFQFRTHGFHESKKICHLPVITFHRGYFLAAN